MIVSAVVPYSTDDLAGVMLRSTACPKWPRSLSGVWLSSQSMWCQMACKSCCLMGLHWSSIQIHLTCNQR